MKLSWRRTALIGTALAILGSCAAEQSGETGGSATRALCGEIERKANAAFRQNFLTEYQNAERAWTDVFALYESRADEVAKCKDAPARSIVLANLGLVYSNQRNFIAAQGMLEASAAAAADDTRDRTQVYRALHDLNRSAVGQATIEQAELAANTAGSQGLALLEQDLSRSVLQLSRRAQRTLIEEAVNNAALAFAYLTRDRLDDALLAIDRALDRVRPVDGAAASYVPRFRVSKAEILLAKGDIAGADTAVTQAINGYGADMRRSALMARAEIVHGQVLAAQGQNEEAFAAFNRGFDILKGATVRVSYDLLYPFVTLIERMIEAEPARRDELNDALFSAAQVVRSQLTASSVSLAAADLADGNGEIAQAVRTLNAATEELALLVTQKLIVEGRSTLSSPEIIAAVERRFNQSRAREEAARARLLQLKPDFFDQISGSAPIAEVQQALGPDEAYIQIILGDPASLVVVIRKDRYRVETVAGLSRNRATRIVANLRQILRDQFIYTPNESYRLYQAFIEPFEPELSGADKLIFSLSDALTAIPMEILARRESPIPDFNRLEDFTDVDWLSDTYDISYVPSPRNLVDFRRTADTSATTRPIIAYGDFQPGADVDEILTQSFLPDDCRPIAEAIAQLPPLEGTRREVETVGEIFGSQRSELVAGLDFNEENIVTASNSGRLKDFAVLHFATHGILPTGDCIRRPALSVSAEGVEGSDGLLTDIEIRKLSLNADLVVLSACDTAGATEGDFSSAGGEALSGLARAFFDAGTRSLLATHWPVGDQVTAGVVRDFYDGLSKGKSMQQALGDAQKAVRSNPATSDPLFWGPFVMIGDAKGRISAQ